MKFEENQNFSTSNKMSFIVCIFVCTYRFLQDNRLITVVRWFMYIVEFFNGYEKIKAFR